MRIIASLLIALAGISVHAYENSVDVYCTVNPDNMTDTCVCSEPAVRDNPEEMERAYCG